MTPSTLIIAEAGVNHNGDLGLALELVDAAAQTGADVVKFQTFSAKSIASQTAPKAAYQIEQTGAGESQLEMLSRLELPMEAFVAIADRCRQKGIAFLSTAGDVESSNVLMTGLKLDTIKLGSGDLSNAPLLWNIASQGRKAILSTGMSILSEVEDALIVLAAGYLSNGRAPSGFAEMRCLYFSDDARDALLENVKLLHCTTEYPAKEDTVNLRAMDTLQAAFGLPVGYSDHTDGHTISVAAVARGATIIEKHFTLDRGMEGPDHLASLDPAGFKALVDAVRLTESALGSPRKVPVGIEQHNRDIVRKSVVAARAVAAGHEFSAGDLAIKRPGHGRSPMEWWDLIGSMATRPYSPDEPIE